MKVCMDESTHTEASVVALGMFDGVHVGHQVLLNKAKKLAEKHGVPLVVQTFAQHPLCLIDPTRCPPQLTTYAERIACLEKAGVDILYAPPFTEAMRDMPPEDYVGHLVRRWRPCAAVVGFNYSFGRGGDGTPAMLHTLGHALGFETSVVPEIRVAGIGVSSTYIRGLLAEGKTDVARYFLGRAYARGAALHPDHTVGRLILCWERDNKQAVGPGTYRCALQSGDKAFPALVSITDGGKVFARVAGEPALANDMGVSFFAERENWTATRQK